MLTIAEIKTKITPICQKYGVERAYLFGSYARGEATEDSDVDLFISPGRIKDLFQLSGFRMDLVEALGLSVDIVSKWPRNKDFSANLKNDGVLMYA